MHSIKRIIILLLGGIVSFLQSTYAQDSDWHNHLQREISLLVDKELDGSLRNTQLSLFVYDLTTDRTIYAHKPSELLRPASIQKIVTSVAALHYLGSNYEFKTQLCYTGEISESILYGDIYVVGGFDPCFSHENLLAFVAQIKEAGIDSIAGRICADLSFKDSLKWGSGWCWDDDMPILTPLLVDGVDDFMPRFVTQLRLQNVRCEQAYWIDVRPRQSTLLAQWLTPITMVLNLTMKDSDNLYAEALFYQLAAQSQLQYATADEARKLINELVSQLGLTPSDYRFADGSGVSLYNYLTAELQIALLRYAYSQEEIYKSFIESFPIAGVDGTLKRRMQKGYATGRIRAKTGTVYGVSTLSGYATAANGNTIAFCIINQGISSGRVGREFQNKVCELLCQSL